MTEATTDAWWGSAPDQSASNLSPQDADLLLRRLHAESSDRPILVDIINSAGDALTVGVGRDASALTFMQASGDPPYLTSRGLDPDSSGTLWFDYDGAETEFGSESSVPLDIALLAVADFLTGHDLSRVSWSEE